MSYSFLEKGLQQQIIEDRNNHVENPYACKDESVLRRIPTRDKASLLRPAFVRDTEKIMNIPFYTRYHDKTQVFSLQKNDDISRRAYHVQLVARIARNIGRILNLNQDLIEAIALGHDLGHTPFGHQGEHKLSEIYQNRCGKFFNHNIQSGRILETIFPVNVSLQTLDGIICHNGELELQEYRPQPIDGFAGFEAKMDLCLNEKDGVKTLIPSTLEGCVVRIADILAYLGKDRQDAVRIGLLQDEDLFSDLHIGKGNAEIINNMTVNLVKNSYGKPYLKMDEEYFEALRRAKRENYEKIYLLDDRQSVFKEEIFPMFEAVYDKLYEDLMAGKKDSVIFTHHIEYIRKYTSFYQEEFLYDKENGNDIVVDAIASMTDDYFIDLYEYLFPKGKYRVTYEDYFKFL